MRLISALTLVCFAACAHNPARPITSNDEEVQVHEEAAVVPGETAAKPVLFTRGADHLDEQEFYASISDTVSYEAVRSSRSNASLLQGVGVGMAVLGFLVAAGGLAAYFLSDASKFSPPPVPIPEDMRTLPIYGGIGGGVLGAGGIALISAMVSKVRGDNLIFDLAHARHSLEVNLYGENGATPDDVKSLTFGAGDEGKRVCAAGALSLAPLVAKDAKGRVMRVSERAEWFSWTTTPRPGLVTRSPDAPVLSSPLTESLADVDAEVGLAVMIPSTQVGHSMTFDQSFACTTELLRDGLAGESGGSGRSGRSGGSGSSRNLPAAGSSGGDGTDGKQGGDGPTVVAEVTWVTTPKRGRLALLVMGDEARLFDPTQTIATVSAAGGRGGSGGPGGSGGDGGSGHIGDCQAGGSGGSGGRGGRGGSGGRGGKVLIRATDRALLDAVEGAAPGGAAGPGGGAGDAGSGGNGSSCKKSGWAAKGARGGSGAPGAPGTPGVDGTVEKELTSLGTMRTLASVLAENPQLKVEDGVFAGPPARPSKRRR